MIGDRFWANWEQDVFTLHRLSQDKTQWCIRWRKYDGLRDSAEQIDGFISKTDIAKGYLSHPGLSFIKVKDDKHLLQLMLKS